MTPFISNKTERPASLPKLGNGTTTVAEQDLDCSTDFLTWVRGGEPAGPPSSDQLIRLRSGLAQLAEQLIALHGGAKLHRHIQPGNIRVTPQDRVVLLNPEPVSNPEITGDAVAYLAPEQAAGRLVSSAGDWYGFGVLLFEALTGRLPFTGGVQQVLNDKQNQPAPLARSLNPDAPEDLNKLCRELMSRLPANRPGGKQVLTRLGPTSVGGAHPAGAGGLVGRVRTRPARPTPSRRRGTGRPP